MSEEKKLPFTTRQFVFSFISFLFIFAVPAYLFAFDRLPPGKLFWPPLVVLIPLGLVAIASLCTRALALHRLKAKPRKLRRRLGRKYIAKRLLILAVICIAIIAGYINYSRAIDARDLESGRQHFTIEVYGYIPEKQIESTLIELERGVSSLRAEYGVPFEEKRKLYLYPDVRTMQRETGGKGSVLGFVVFEDGKPVVYLPAEPVRDPLAGESGSPTPRHEALHVVFAELLGEHKMRAVPLWFNEGVASYEGLKGQQFMWLRLCLRFELWQRVTPITPARILLSQQPATEHIDHAFYLTAFELVRYIVATRGDGVLSVVVNEVMRGTEFEQAFKKACGIGTADMYEEWLREFL